MQHIIKNLKPRSEDFNYVEAHQQCINFIVDDASKQCCCRPKGFSKFTTKCDCLIDAFIEDDDDTVELVRGVASYMIHWSTMKLDSRRAVLYEWSRFAGHIRGGEGETI